MLRSLLGRLEGWFAAPEVNAAGRMGLYRILYGLWFLWLFAGIDFGGLAARPYPPPKPVGVMALLTALPVTVQPAEFARLLAFLLGGGLVLLTFGLATRSTTGLVLVCSALLFAWDSSSGKVIDKYVLLGTIVPFWMFFSRWGETYSLDALIRKARGLPTPSPSEPSWEFIWPQRAVVIFTVVLYFSAGYMKTVEGTWLDNPYVVLDKLTDTLVIAWASKPANFNSFLYPLVLRAPAVFIVGQSMALAFELGVPLALINRHFLVLVFSGAVLFHTLTLLSLGIGFAPMVIVLAIIVDWQAVWGRLRLTGLPLNRPSTVAVVGPVCFALTLAGLVGSVALSPSLASSLRAVVPDQKFVWLLAAPFAALSVWRSARHILGAGRTHLRRTRVVDEI
jgi:hypothetical protein